jgi:hypothetical protein
MIIKNAHKMIDLMGNVTIILCPTLIKIWSSWKACASNFNGQDFAHFIKSLKHIYLNHNGLEAAFAKNQESDSMQNSISEFKKCFLKFHYQRTQNMFQIL